MIKLMALEFKKITVWKYLVSVLLAVIFIAFIIVVVPFLAEEGDVLFNTSAEMLSMSALLLRVTFTIFTGVLIANVIIKEYETGTIVNLFLYPISKKKLLLSKLLVVIASSLLLLILSQLILGGIIVFANNTGHLTSSRIQSTNFLQFLLTSFFYFVATIATSMISLYVGLKTKSSVTTIVAAVIISLLVNGNIGSSENSLSRSFLTMGVLTLIGIVITVISLKNVYRENV